MKTYSRCSNKDQSTGLKSPIDKELGESRRNGNFALESVLASLPTSKKSKITDFFNKKIVIDKEISDASPLTKPKDHKSNLPCKKSTRPEKMQTFLDFGQKGLFMKTCTECNMIFDPSFEEDVARHQREHSRWFECFDGNRYEKIAVWKKKYKNADTMLRIDGKHQSIQELCNRINQEMAALEQTEKELENMQIYLYIQKKKVIGLMSIQPTIKTATMIKDKDPGSSKETVSVFLGVCRIWTCPKERRKGIAMELLANIRKCNHESDVLCHQSTCIVPADMIAFSQPTTMGSALYKKFQNNENNKNNKNDDMNAHSSHIIIYN